jgi:hypothetical protein
MNIYNVYDEKEQNFPEFYTMIWCACLVFAVGCRSFISFENCKEISQDVFNLDWSLL